MISLVLGSQKRPQIINYLIIMATLWIFPLCYNIEYCSNQLFSIKMFYTLRALLALFICVDSNLLCSGDLQANNTGSYSLSLGLYGINYLWRVQTNNPICWYNSNGPILQFKKGIQIFTSNCLDMAFTSPDVICQKVLLQPKIKYKIQYDCFNAVESYINLVAKVEEKIVAGLQVNSILTFGHEINYFWSEEREQVYEAELCFEDISTPTYLDFGPMLDNVTLFMADFYELRFSCQVFENQSKIVLSPGLAYNQTIGEEIINNFIFKATAKDKNIEFIFIYTFVNTSNLLDIVLYPNSSFLLSDLMIQEKVDSHRHEMILMNFSIQHQNKSYTNFTESEKVIIERLAYYSVEVSWLFDKIILFFKDVFCSYYIFNILGFWVVALLYIFLLIPSIPEFTKAAYYQMFGSIIELGNIFKWISKETDSPYALDPLSVDRIMTQKIPSEIGEDRWFGDFSFSMDFIANNIDNYFTLLLLLVKLLVIKLIAYFILRRILKIVIVSNFQYSLLLVAEVSAMTPEFLISAVSNLTTASLTYKETLNKIGQVILFSICLFSISSHAFLQCKITKFKQLSLGFTQKRDADTNQANKENSKRTVSFKIWVYCCNGLDIALILFTPLFVTLQNPCGFLVINGMLILLKLIAYFKVFMKYSILDRIIAGLINITWLVHHIIFCIFYCISELEHQSVVYEYPILIKLLGIAAILTIFTGGCLQIIKFILHGIFFVINLYKMMRRTNDPQIVPKSEVFKQRELNVNIVSIRSLSTVKSNKQKKLEIDLDLNNKACIVPNIFESKHLKSYKVKAPPKNHIAPNILIINSVQKNQQDKQKQRQIEQDKSQIQDTFYITAKITRKKPTKKENQEKINSFGHEKKGRPIRR